MFSLCMYNAWTLLSNDQLEELEEEASKINFDIIGPAERARSSLAENKKRITELRKSDESVTSETREIDHIVQEFYTKLYGGKTDCVFVTREGDELFLQIMTQK
uniref:Uncharacterized protein n=1 Tax=Parascaris univalens TaxID=6257 RepID=A0A915AM15_PARUN